MKFLILVAAFVGMIGVVRCFSPPAEADTQDDAITSPTKEEGKVAKRGIAGYGHHHESKHNPGWGWGQDNGYNGGNDGWGWNNNYVSDYGFKIGPQKHGDGWGWGWGGQSFTHFNPGWTSHGHAHGHGHGNGHGHGHGYGHGHGHHGHKNSY